MCRTSRLIVEQNTSMPAIILCSIESAIGGRGQLQSLVRSSSTETCIFSGGRPVQETALTTSPLPAARTSANTFSPRSSPPVYGHLLIAILLVQKEEKSCIRRQRHTWRKNMFSALHHYFQLGHT